MSEYNLDGLLSDLLSHPADFTTFPPCGLYYFSRKFKGEEYDAALDDLLSTLYEHKATPGSFRNKQQYDTWTCRSDWKKK
jgi:hypothetical protein